MIRPVDIAEGAVDKLRLNIQAAMEDRGKNASGGTSRGIAVIPSQGQGFGAAALEADHQWRYVGNGRGPGGFPPIARIESWLRSRGLQISAWGVARKIAKEGSRDYRLKRRNIFVQEIEAWEREELPKADEQMLDYLAAGIDDVLTNAKQ